MIRQLAHICFFTDRLEQMIYFYTEKLGLRIKFTLDNKDGIPFGYYFECGQSTFLEIFDQSLAVCEWGGNAEKLVNRAHYQHLCFEVTDLKAYRQHLTAQGIAVTEITEGLDRSIQAWVNDPDGNAIELMEYTFNSLQLRGQSHSSVNQSVE
jgi:lactoylglutathione lyase